MKGYRIYAVIKTETDRDGAVIRTESDVRFVGAFEDVDDAFSAINRELLDKAAALREAKAVLAEPLREKLKAALRAAAEATEPAKAAEATAALDAISEKLRRYTEEALPEFLIGRDGDGNLCEVSARDEELGWLCCYDIVRTEVR